MPDETIVTPSPAVSDSKEDLSREIAKRVEKESQDQVTCRRISENYYRCNWWAPRIAAEYDNPHMLGAMVATHCLRKSRFLHVIKSGDGLQITVITPENSRLADE